MMKKHHLIVGCTIVFLLLFYNESLGVNWGLFCLVGTGLIYSFFKARFVDYSYWVLLIASVLSCFAFAWYGDFVSFAAVALSLIFLQFKTQDPQLKIILALPLVALNSFASLVRIFQFGQWLPKRKIASQLAKKIIAYGIIPAVFATLFYIVYSFGSNHFSGLFANYSLMVDLPQLIGIGLLGFYISFTFWNYWVPQYCYDVNPKLEDGFSKETKAAQQHAFSFLDRDFERRSGEITLVLLNGLILVFIGAYNYEQFFEYQAVASLSTETHERVNAVIFSIVMAVGVLLFFFKNGFNFDPKAGRLKVLANVWIGMNAVLITSTVIKNVEYVAAYGLTYKRLGVFAFLLAAFIGLGLTFFKIYRQKTNAYLFHRMMWVFYGFLLISSYVNWGKFITTYNIAVNKGVEPDYLRSLHFNEASYPDYFSAKPQDAGKLEELHEKVAEEQHKSWLSCALYYKSLPIP